MNHGLKFGIYTSLLGLLIACGGSSRDFTPGSAGAAGLDEQTSSGGAGTGGTVGSSGGAAGAVQSGGTGGAVGIAGQGGELGEEEPPPPDETSNGGADSVAGAAGAGGAAGGSNQGCVVSDDTTPPTVVSISPANEKSHVMDEPVIIEFSEAMNKASVEAAFPGSTNFEWNPEGTKVEFTYPYPFTSSIKPHTITVPTTVKDEACNALQSAASTSIVLASLKSVVLPYDGAMVGNQVAGGTAYTFLFGGDSSSNKTVYGGIGFDISSLPAHKDIRALRRATVKTQIIKRAGDPNDRALEGFVVDYVRYKSRSGIAAATVLSSAFRVILQPGDVTLGAPLSIPVNEQFTQAWKEKTSELKHFQIRFYARRTDNDSLADYTYLRRGADENGGVVGTGVKDPDPDNALRLEIEYFEK